MDCIIGIDFGTTNTVISMFENNKTVIINDGIFKTIPSRIGYMNDKIYCGNYIPLNCPKVIHSFKLLIGKDNIDELLITFLITYS